MVRTQIGHQLTPGIVGDRHGDVDHLGWKTTQLPGWASGLWSQVKDWVDTSPKPLHAGKSFPLIGNVLCMEVWR